MNIETTHRFTLSVIFKLDPTNPIPKPLIWNPNSEPYALDCFKKQSGPGDLSPEFKGLRLRQAYDLIDFVVRLARGDFIYPHEDGYWIRYLNLN